MSLTRKIALAGLAAAMVATPTLSQAAQSSAAPTGKVLDLLTSDRASMLLPLGGELLPRLAFPLEVAYLHATRYGHALQGNLLDWRVRPTQDLRGRTVLVLDDILDEGHTLAAIVDHLKAEGAASVHTAVLVHKEHDRKATPGMRADVTGLDIPDRFLFGCGMDYKGYWRNAPGIYALKGH